MNDPDLKHALRSVAETERPVVDPLDDLVRAKAALTTRNRRRFRAGLGGLAVLAVIGVGVGAAIGGTGTDVPSAGPSTAGGVQLVASRFDATPYTFDLTPVGWSVQALKPTAVTIVPDDGSVSGGPDVFVGKLVILFDANPLSGRVVDHHGRKIWVSGDSDYVAMATPSQPGEPTGVVRIQYPRGAGWSDDAMEAFLASVHVGPTAQLGHG